MSTSSVDRLAGVSSSLAIKAPCDYTTTANITLSGLAVQAGGTWASTLTQDDANPTRILVKNQTNAIDNGLWNPGAGTWTRCKDFDGARDVVRGTVVHVYQFDGDLWFEVSTANPIAIGTSEINFVASTAASILARLASTASAAEGDALLGTKRTATDAEAMTQHQRTEMASITLHDFIPASLHAAIILGTNTTDLSPYIQNFLDHLLVNGGCGEIYGGCVYKCDDPVTLQRSSASHATDLAINGNGARFDCTQLAGSESGLKVGATSTSYFLEKGSWTINDIALLGPESVSPIGTSAPITTSIGLDLQYAAQLTLNGVRAHDWYKGCKSLFVFPLQANRCNFRDNIVGLHLDEASNLQTWFETTLVECRYPLLIRSESTSLDSGKSNNITFVKYWTEGSVVGPVIDSGAGGGGAVRYRDIQFYSHYASGITYDMFRVGLQWTLATPQTRNANCSEFIEGLRIVDGVWNPGGGSFGATNSALCFDSVGRACNVFADIEIPSPDTDADVMIERPRNSTLRFRGAPGTFGQNVVSWMTNNDRSVVQRLNPNGTMLMGASKANVASVNETGIELAASGSVLATRDSDVPMRANRQTNDGYLFAAYRRDTLAGGMLTDPSTAKIIFMTDATNNVFVAAGTGTPESVVTAGPGSLFLRSDGGASTTLYVKTSGTGNTGWTAK